MGSQKTLKLPRIDFPLADMQPDSGIWSLIRAQVQDALETYGCFEAVYPRVPQELREAIFPALKELFELPITTKMLNSSSKPFHGYVGQYPQAPLFESMGIDDADEEEKVQSFTNLMWPQGNPDFSETVLSFVRRVSSLDQIVRRLVLESLGLEEYLGSHLDSTNYLLRMMRYEPPRTDEPKLGLSTHTDKNIVTILYQNQEGLEVLTKGGDWIPVAASTDSFVVMVGDSFLAWTNGRLHSARHRVMKAGRGERYSLGLFSIPKAGHVVQAPAELVDEDHPLLFKPFDHVEFLKFYYTAEGQRAESALATYCGATD